jgi:hypothetical protein
MHSLAARSRLPSDHYEAGRTFFESPPNSLRLVSWKSYKPPSWLDYTKTPLQIGGCSYLLIEKSPKTAFFDRNLQQDITLIHFVRNRCRFKKFLLQAILSYTVSFQKFQESYTVHPRTSGLSGITIKCDLYLVLYLLLYHWESILAIVVFPSQKIIMNMNIWCTAVM